MQCYQLPIIARFLRHSVHQNPRKLPGRLKRRWIDKIPSALFTLEKKKKKNDWLMTNAKSCHVGHFTLDDRISFPVLHREREHDQEAGFLRGRGALRAIKS